MSQKLLEKKLSAVQFFFNSFFRKSAMRYAIFIDLLLIFFKITKWTVFNKQKFNFEDHQYFQIRGPSIFSNIEPWSAGEKEKEKRKTN